MARKRHTEENCEVAAGECSVSQGQDMADAMRQIGTSRQDFEFEIGQLSDFMMIKANFEGLDHKRWRIPEPTPILNELAELVAIPASRREEFIQGIEIELEGAHQYNWYKLHGLIDSALLAAEKRLLAASAAVQALRPQQQQYLKRALFRTTDGYFFNNEDDADLGAILAAAVFAMSSMTGSDMETLHKKGKRRGPTPGSTRDFPLQFFIEGFWHTVVGLGGGLCASCKSGKGCGTLFEALRLLGPILPEKFVRAGTDQTIANFAKRLRYALNPRAQAMGPEFLVEWEGDCARAWERGKARAVARRPGKRNVPNNSSKCSGSR